MPQEVEEERGVAFLTADAVGFEQLQWPRRRLGHSPPAERGRSGKMVRAWGLFHKRGFSWALRKYQKRFHGLLNTVGNNPTISISEVGFSFIRLRAHIKIDATCIEKQIGVRNLSALLSIPRC